jgi:hypothetical protein
VLKQQAFADRTQCPAPLSGMTIDRIVTKYRVHPISAVAFYVPVSKHRSGKFDSKQSTATVFVFPPV